MVPVCFGLDPLCVNYGLFPAVKSAHRLSPKVLFYFERGDADRPVLFVPMCGGGNWPEGVLVMCNLWVHASP